MTTFTHNGKNLQISATFRDVDGRIKHYIKNLDTNSFKRDKNGELIPIDDYKLRQIINDL